MSLSLKLYTYDYEASPVTGLFPVLLHASSVYNCRELHLRIYNILKSGGRIYVKIHKGARAGTVGYLDLDISRFEKFENFYQARNNSYYPFGAIDNNFIVKFDDSSSTIKFKLEYHNNNKMIKSMTVHSSVPDNKTVYVYKTTPAVKKDPVVLYDQFGVLLQVGQTVITMHGKDNDYYTVLAKIQRISDAGTIWIKTIPTPGRKKVEETFRGVYSSNCMVVDDEFMNRILLTQLAR